MEGVNEKNRNKKTTRGIERERITKWQARIAVLAVIILSLFHTAPHASAQEATTEYVTQMETAVEPLPYVPELQAWMVENRLDYGTGTFTQEGKRVYFVSDGSENKFNLQEPEVFCSDTGEFLAYAPLYFKFELKDGTIGFGSTDEVVVMYNVKSLDFQFVPFEGQYN